MKRMNKKVQSYQLALKHAKTLGYDLKKFRSYYRKGKTEYWIKTANKFKRRIIYNSNLKIVQKRINSGIKLKPNQFNVFYNYNINKNTSFVNPLLKHCKTHINLEKIVKIPIPKRIFILKKQLQSALKLTLKKYTFNSQDFKRSKKILQYNLNKQNYIKKKCVNLDIKKHFKL